MRLRIGRGRVKMIVAGIGIFIVAAFIALLLISGIGASPKYLEPWQPEYAQQADDPRISLVARGLLAASGHNMQPWKVRLDPADSNVLDLYADSTRLTPEVDPLSRQMMVTQGTFLEYVRIAGQQEGYDVEIRLFPEGEYDERHLTASMEKKPVARITLTQAEPRTEPLYPFLYSPDTNRGAYEPGKLSSEAKATLEGIGDGYGVQVTVYQDEDNVQKLGEYAIRAAKIEASVRRVMKETELIFRANEREKNEYRYGFSVEGQGTQGLMRHLMQGMVTLFPSLNVGQAAADTFVKSTQTSVDHTSVYAMIVASENTRSAQVLSGMAYSRLILEAHRLGLAVQPLSQALEEYPEMKAEYDGIHRDYAPGGGSIQMLVRVGRPTQEAPLSMRRDVMNLMMDK
ncbi:hypothetical protein IM700_004680 [Paenibacillus sp. DXFW5]|uniref:Nitroreductase domain-containing protein n=2 Tax=Paenibacillus rhizolycopersici TaxID=2780073 RepID=A0ABS2H615_9BACL|nr:hypothetical protein [Paenibacillus rhizolycopersici]